MKKMLLFLNEMKKMLLFLNEIKKIYSPCLVSVDYLAYFRRFGGVFGYLAQLSRAVTLENRPKTTKLAKQTTETRQGEHMFSILFKNSNILFHRKSERETTRSPN